MIGLTIQYSTIPIDLVREALYLRQIVRKEVRHIVKVEFVKTMVAGSACIGKILRGAIATGIYRGFSEREGERHRS